jgi:uncharacterized protein YwqG
MSIDFSKFGDEYMRVVYFPIFEEIQSKETGTENKIGGISPFFIEGEKWPVDDNNNKMTFVCQFINPMENNNFLHRIFFPINSFNGYLKGECFISKIELNEENLSKQIKINIMEDIIIYPPYKIISWNKSKELLSFTEVCKLLKIDSSNIFYDKYYDEYHEHEYTPSSTIKVGGTSIFCQKVTDLHKFKNIFQMTSCDQLPFEFGDSGIGHILEDIDCGNYYFYYDE